MALLTSGPLTLDTEGFVTLFVEAVGDWSDLGHIDSIHDACDVPTWAACHLPRLQAAWADHLADAVSDAELHDEWRHGYLHGLIG